MQRLMLDIETFSRQPNAAVFEVAIVPFNEDGTVDPVECASDLGLWQWTPKTGHFEGETVAWWMQRGGRVDLNAAGGMGEAEVVGKIYEYLTRFPESELWSGPSSFDCVILQQLFERYSHKMPVGFRQYRDLTTLRAAAGFPVVPRTRTKHQAFNDCLHQIAVYAECRRILGLGGGQPSRTLPVARAANCDEVGTGRRPAEPTTRQFAGPPAGCPNGTPLPGGRSPAEFARGLLRRLPTSQEFAEASTSLARGTPGAAVDEGPMTARPPQDDGGPAFPFGGFALPNDEWLEVSGGVSKRELCSWLAMVGILANSDPHRVRRVGIRTEAERMADAMMGHTPTPAALTDNQVAYLEEKRGSDVWTAADFNRHLRSMLD